MKRIVITIVVAGALLAGCGGGHPVAYRPAAYGENAQCYYVNSPAEAIALQAQGLCDRSWVPTLMPGYWHQRYYPYYASPAYYSVYVPATSRSTYATSERTWGSANQTAIATASKDANYQGSNGKIVSAEKIGATKYGGGARFGPVGTKFGGGSGRVGGAPAATPAPTPSQSPSSPSGPASPAPKSSPGVGSTPAPHSSGGSKSFGGGSGRPSSGGGGGHSYGGGGGRRH